MVVVMKQVIGNITYHQILNNRFLKTSEKAISKKVTDVKNAYNQNGNIQPG